ncbi:hypothetical protein HN51_011083 [Arachis hypogaea]
MSGCGGDRVDTSRSNGGVRVAIFAIFRRALQRYSLFACRSPRHSPLAFSSFCSFFLLLVLFQCKSTSAPLILFRSPGLFLPSSLALSPIARHCSPMGRHSFLIVAHSSPLAAARSSPLAATLSDEDVN